MATDNNDFTHEFQIYSTDKNAGTMGTGKFLLFDDNINAVKVESIDNIKIGGGSNGRVLATDGAGNLYWMSAAAVTGGVSNYNDLNDLPDLSVYAQTSALAAVATSGSYNDLTNKPNLFSGSYTDLTNKPTLVTSYNQLTDKPTIPSVPTTVSSFTNDAGYLTSVTNITGNAGTVSNGVYTTGSYANPAWITSLAYSKLTDAPTLATVATSGSYSDLTNRPTIFSGAYADLKGKPTLFDGAYLSLTGLPNLAAVATSGSYNDLINKPSIPDLTGYATEAWVTSQGYGSGSGSGAQGPAGADGAQGIPGTPGADGADGAPGQGVPTGGTTGQVLAKIDGTDYSTEWVTLTSGNGPTNEITNTDGNNTYSVSVGTDGVVTMNTVRGSIEFGAMPEVGGPTHLHIMRPAGAEGATDLYFGDDYNYVKMPSSSYSQQGVEIGSSLNQGAVSVWRFGTDGDLVLPSGKTIRDTSGTDLLAGDTGGDPAYKGFKASYGRMWGNSDDPNGPINKIVIYKDTVTPSSTIDASTNDDTFTVTGLTGSDVVAMLVVIGDEVNQTTTAELKTFAESVIDNVILDGGIEGNLNSINGMRTAFYNNFATFSATITDRKANFEFFSINNQFSISPTFATGDGANFSGISYNMDNDTLDLGSWGQGAPNTHEVNDVYVIPGNTIQDANGNFLLTPDNDITVTITGVADGWIQTFTVTGTLPRPTEIWPNNSINDGGDDEYDTGNYITTNLESNISYNSGAPIFNSTAFGGGDYVVTYQNSIFGVFAVNPVIDSIATQGGSGFDGNGQADTGSLYGAVSSGVSIGDFVFTNSTLTATEDDLYIKAVDDLWLDALQDDIHIRANDDVRIKVGYDFDADSAQQEWRFDTSGYISFPNGSQQSTAWTGSVDYNDVNNKPTLFSGDYDDLNNKPTIRIAVATGSGPGGNLQADSLALAGLNPVTDIPSTWGGDLILQGGVGGANGDLYGEVRIKSGTIGANYEWHFTTDKKIRLPAGGDIVDSNGDSVLSSFGGSYNDLTDKPTIPADTSDLTNNAGFITSSELSTSSSTITLTTLFGTTSDGQGTNISISDNPKTEQILLTHSLGGVARATLQNISTVGKIVILTSNKSSPQEIYVNAKYWPGINWSNHIVSNSTNGIKILMSLGSNGWKQIQTND